MEASLGQYCINVTDIERSVEFWDGVIGIPLQSRTEIPNAKEACSRPRRRVAHPARAAPRPQGPIDMGSAMWKLYVNTDDCQALYDKAIAAGCESVSARQQLDRWPVTVAYIKDLDGYLIELLQNHEGRRPALR